MAFTGNYMPTSFKSEILQAKHNLTNGAHTFNLALYTNSASFDASTTDYTVTNEVSGTGYTAGGAALTNVTPTTGGVVGFTDFADLTFSSATITARGALIYNTTYGGGTGTTEAVGVYDFGSDKTSSAGDFTIIFPTASSTDAVIRIA